MEEEGEGEEEGGQEGHWAVSLVIRTVANNHFQVHRGLASSPRSLDCRSHT